MLPHFVAQDFREVLADLNRAGYPFEAEWFAPHFEFRYPVFGHAHHAGIDIEVRQATEPWYVLGEEGTTGGTARYVDSSVERVQIRTDRADREPVRGDVQWTACADAFHRQARRMGRGCALPGVAASFLPASDDSGTYSAGVRHPGYFGRDAPWEGAPIMWRIRADSIPTTFPVNSNEAEARRGSRFFAFGHTPGPMKIPGAGAQPGISPDARLAETTARRGRWIFVGQAIRLACP